MDKENASWPAKHNWREIARETPPKRDAAERICDFDEIYGLFDEATAREQASRCINCPDPLCAQACPLGNRIPEWLALVADGRFLEAAELSRSTSNLPEICSRVCPQERLCEGGCILNAISDPVSIGAVEKFINEYAFAHETMDAAVAPPNGRKVAVVGSGPVESRARMSWRSSVTPSRFLKRKAAPVAFSSTAFLPSSSRKRSWNGDLICCADAASRSGAESRSGAMFRSRCCASSSMRSIWRSARKNQRSLVFQGQNLRGVFHALPFLIQMNLGETADGPLINVRGKRVAVLGGGDTAMDCLRTALRGGAQEAVCLYRRDLENMPGSRREYLNATEEGARFMFLTNPIALLGNDTGAVAQARCVRMELGEPDAKGRRKPRVIPGSEFTVPVDVVLVAFGFDPVPIFAAGNADQIEVNQWGGVVVDSGQMTSVPGVFAGGDLVRGPDLVVRAVR